MVAARVKTVTRTVGATTDPNLQDALAHRLRRFSNLTDNQIAALVLTLDPDVVEAVSDSVLASMVSGVLPTLPLNPSGGLPLGLPGAVQATRYVGGTASAAPTTGSFLVGDFVVIRTGGIAICTTAGTPGTWATFGSGASAPLPSTIRNPLTGMFHVDGFGAVPDGSTDSWAAIQAAIDLADQWNSTTNTAIGGKRGGMVFLPAGPEPYMISKALICDARVQLIGQNGALAGGVGTRIRAITTGNFTNGANTDKWMLKLSRSGKATANWFHGGAVEKISFDCNQTTGLGGIWGMSAGELSRIDRVQVYNSGITSRTVSSVSFDGTDIINASGLGADVLEDMAAKVTSASFPTYSPTVVTGLGTTNASTTVTGTGLSTSLKGAEITATNAAAYLGTYVVSVAGDGSSMVLSRPVEATATGRSMTFDQPRNFRIVDIISATSVRLSRPVPYTGTGSVTVDRPRPGIRFDSWSATGDIGSLNLSSNSGAGIEFTAAGSNRIANVAGDNNGGPLIRFHKCAISDPRTVVLDAFKAENNNYGDATSQQYENYGDHDSVILIDRCGMLNLEIAGGGASAGDRSTRDLIRIQGSTGTWQSGFPSLTVKGLEADNPFNQNFENLIRDADTGKKVVSGRITSPSLGGRFYPTISWYKDNRIVNGDLRIDGGRVYVDGAALAASLDNWRQPINMDASPNAVVQGVWNVLYYGAAMRTTQGFNFSNAQNDGFVWYAPLSAGTWRLDYFPIKDPASAIQTWDISFDSGATWTALGTYDGYAATKAIATMQSFTGITVPTSCVAQLRCQALTRNAPNTTGWYLLMSAATFVRTA